ncbi:hypothetical protein BH11BAC2_BH11BAC2_18970 [soil metagenome]
MKDLMLSLIIVLSALTASAQQSLMVHQGDAKIHQGTVTSSINKIGTVDLLDSVVFDYSQAIVFGDTIEFPVSFLSDDTIYTLDFSFKYNQIELVFDSIINLTSGLQSLYFYNTNDSTIRFTSNSLQQCTNDTAIVKIRFVMLNGQFNPAYVNTIKGYLNGDGCSIKIPNYSAVGIEDLNAKDGISIYPNPGRDLINVETSRPSNIQLLDSNGKIVLSDNTIFEKHSLNTTNISPGFYLLKIESGNFFQIRKIILE